MSNANMPAMPITGINGLPVKGNIATAPDTATGLTKREYMATQLAVTYLAQFENISTIETGMQSVASCAVTMADALLKELESGN